MRIPSCFCVWPTRAMRPPSPSALFLVSALFCSSAVFLGGCGSLGRLGGIETSTKKTEKTTGELNENTKDVKTSIEEVEASSRAMQRELESTRKELEDANARLTKTNDELSALKDVMGATQRNTNDLVGNTGNTYVDLRQGDTLSARMRQLDRLSAVDALESKISEAWKYFAAFEFQFWKGEGFDTSERLAVLYYEGLNEFLRDLERYLPAERDRSGSPLSENAGMKNLYALATALEAVNSVQSSAQGEQAKSMHDLLREALQAGADVEAGRRASEALLPWERIVLEKEDTALFVLHVRMNFLPAIPLASLTNVERSGFARLWDLLRLGFGRWEARLERLNNTQIQGMNAWLQKSLSEQTFLQGLQTGASQGGARRRNAAAGRAELGLGAYHASLRQAYANMRVVDGAADASHGVSGALPPVAQERVALVGDFKQAARKIAN